MRPCEANLGLMPKPDYRSKEAKAYRRLYKTKRWHDTRDMQLRLQPLCERCSKAGKVTVATVCHHIDKSTKDNPDTFFAGPFASMCKTCHDGAVQKEERSGLIEAQFDASGRVMW